MLVAHNYGLYDYLRCSANSIKLKQRIIAPKTISRNDRLSIGNYQDYIKFCENAPVSGADVGRIVHTYRILFNKLKHSSCIEIIKSRDDESIRKKELDDIEQEIERFQAIQQIDAQYVTLVTSELERLKFRKEIVEKARYAYAHLDFEDSEFKRSNGISVVDDTGNRFYIAYSAEIGHLSAPNQATCPLKSATRRMGKGVAPGWI